jgi:hypothetical protein
MMRTAKVQRAVDCPKCKKKMRPYLLERLEAVRHIPARYKVKCSECAEVFYMVADNGA